MSSADKVALVDTVNGAGGNAGAAVGTERVIDDRKIVNDLDSAARAGLFALLTADTAVLALLAHDSAGLVVGALYYDTGRVNDKVDKMLGAGVYANATAYALLCVYVGDAVLEVDRILGAGNRTVAVAKTGGGTGLVAAVGKVCRNTVGLAAVIVLFVYRAAYAVTSDVRNLFNDVLSLNSEAGGDSLCGFVTAGNAEVACGSALGKCLGVAVASAVSAGAAVSTGKAVTHCKEGFVLLNAEINARYGKQHRTEKCRTDENKCRNENKHDPLPPYASRFSTTPAKP